MIKDGQCKFTFFRGDVLARRAIHSAMSIVGGYMLLATMGNAYVYQRRGFRKSVIHRKLPQKEQ